MKQRHVIILSAVALVPCFLAGVWLAGAGKQRNQEIAATQGSQTDTAGGGVTVPMELGPATSAPADVALADAPPIGRAAAPSRAGRGVAAAARGVGGGFAGRGVSTPAGPPAPVPPQVAQGQPPRANSAIAPVQNGVRTSRHGGFADTASKGDIDLLLDGDSLMDWWQMTGGQAGAEAFKKYFGDMKVANFAVAGDTTQGLLWGLQNGEGRNVDGTPVAMRPKAIMLEIGTNNSASNTGPEIAEGVGAVVLELRRDFPEAKILLLAIFPRGTSAGDRNRVTNEEANEIISKLDDGQHIFFRNINDKFLKPDGSLIGFRSDNLHPNAEGYEIWGSEVAGILKGWVK